MAQLIEALKNIAFEISLLRKQLEKVDRTISKLNESPIDIKLPD